MGETVRTQRYRYTAWVGSDTGQIVSQELYDQVNDPIEGLNVAKNQDYLVELERHEELRNLGWRHVRDGLEKITPQHSIQ